MTRDLAIRSDFGTVAALRLSHTQAQFMCSHFLVTRISWSPAIALMIVCIVLYRRFCMPVWSRPLLLRRDTVIPCHIDAGIPAWLWSFRRIGGYVCAHVDPTSASNQPLPSHSSFLVPSYGGKTVPYILRLGVSYSKFSPSFNVLLAVHHAMIHGNCPTWRTNSFQCIYLFIVLYMFRACHAYSQPAHDTATNTEWQLLEAVLIQFVSPDDKRDMLETCRGL